MNNGTVGVEGAGANALGDPLFFLTWLANHLSKRGIGIKAGRHRHHRHLHYAATHHAGQPVDRPVRRPPPGGRRLQLASIY